MSLRNCLILLLISFIHIPSLFCQTDTTNDNNLNKNYALLFALEKYDNNDTWENLPNTINAAKEIAQELEDSYGFQTKVVPNPTQEEILQNISEYSKIDFGEYGQLLIFFSGHGTIKEKGKRKRMGFLATKDSKNSKDDKQFNSFLRHTTLSAELDFLECRHILVILDACFSSTFGSDINNSITLADPKKKYLRTKQSIQEFQKEELKYTSRLYLSSGNTKTFASSDNDYSPFTNTFLSSLRENGLYKDLIITFDEIKVYFNNQRLIPRPKGGKFGSHEPGGNFLLTRQSKVPIITRNNQEVNISIGTNFLKTEEYKLKKTMRDTWGKYQKVSKNTMTKILKKFEVQKIFRVFTANGKLKSDEFNQNKYIGFMNDILPENRIAIHVNLSYEAPFFRLKCDKKLVYEVFRVEEIDWGLVETFLENEAIKKFESKFGN